jgi:hypothetical protein
MNYRCASPLVLGARGTSGVGFEHVEAVRQLVARDLLAIAVANHGVQLVLRNRHHAHHVAGRVAGFHAGFVQGHDHGFERAVGCRQSLDHVETGQLHVPVERLETHRSLPMAPERSRDEVNEFIACPRLSDGGRSGGST